MRRLANLVLVGALAAGSAACGEADRPVSVGASAPVSDPTERVASTEAWRLRGEELRAQKRSRSKGVYQDVANDADFAYASQPIDVVTPGRYVVYFGPVNDSFRLEQLAGGMYWPSDTGFPITPGLQDAAVLDGKRFLKVDLLIDGSEFRPYPGFYGWIA